MDPLASPLRTLAILALSILGSLGSAPRVGSAVMRLVPESYPTIQAALNVAVSGDEVSVGPGVYVENVSAVNAGVTLRSRFPHAATIQGTGTHHTVVFSNVSGAIRDFVITGAGTGFRSGVFIGNANASVTVENNLIRGNQSHGVTVAANGTALIRGNRITDNGTNGLMAGINVAQGGLATIVNNYVSGNGAGVSGLSSPADGLVVVNNTFVDNLVYGLLLVDHLTTVRNNIIVGSRYGISIVGGYAPDRTAFAAQYLAIDHNLLWDNSVADYHAELGTFSTGGTGSSNIGPFSPTPGTGEVLADPAIDVVSGYRLSAGSPAIDAGNGTSIPVDTPLDLDGRTRRIDDPTEPDVGLGSPPIDIGAQEFPGPPEVPSLGRAALGVVLLGLLLTGLAARWPMLRARP